MLASGKKSGISYGDFGALATHYEKSRFGYPSDVFSYIQSWLPLPYKSPTVLDIGCGTGISTRQLEILGGTVIGCDQDERMIALAKKTDPKTGRYHVASAENLPFQNRAFDLVTAFGSFHWFSPLEATKELSRVLKPNGWFFIVQKRDVGDFRPGCLKALTPYFTHRDPSHAPRDDDIVGMLRDHAFTEFTHYTIETTEYFTLTRALSFLQSVWEWNLVQQSDHADALHALEAYCGERIGRNGFIARPICIVVLGARRSKRLSPLASLLARSRAGSRR